MKRLALLLFVLLGVTSTAHGFGGLFRRSAPASSSSSYYYGPPAYVMPAAPSYPLYAVPSAPLYVAPPYAAPVVPMEPATVLPATRPIVVPDLAAPSPAPPSLTPDAPESSTSMRVNTKYYDLFPSANGKGDGDRLSVAFWNLTGRAVTLTVNGQNRTLSNGQSLTLEVPRTFRWQVEGRGAETVQMASGDKGAEILLRK